MAGAIAGHRALLDVSGWRWMRWVRFVWGNAPTVGNKAATPLSRPIPEKFWGGQKKKGWKFFSRLCFFFVHPSGAAVPLPDELEPWFATWLGRRNCIALMSRLALHSQCVAGFEALQASATSDG